MEDYRYNMLIINKFFDFDNFSDNSVLLFNKYNNNMALDRVVRAEALKEHELFIFIRNYEGIDLYGTIFQSIHFKYIEGIKLCSKGKLSDLRASLTKGTYIMGSLDVETYTEINNVFIRKNKFKLLGGLRKPNSNVSVLQTRTPLGVCSLSIRVLGC